MVALVAAVSAIAFARAGHAKRLAVAKVLRLHPNKRSPPKVATGESELFMQSPRSPN
jgi:hypothetical protein